MPTNPFVFAALAVWSFVQYPMAAAQNEMASLKVTTEGGQSTYQMGERIPLDLSFTGPPAKRFEISLASYDRSGRMRYEEFDVDPRSGWSDPLALYFGLPRIFFGGGPSSREVLSPKPVVLHLDLNEWVRFDKTGRYRVIVTTHRVSDRLLQEQNREAASQFVVKSNPLDLTIIPAKEEWRAAKLADIVTKLAGTQTASSMPSPSRAAAIADLRYLGTPAAAQVMAEHLRDDQPNVENQCAFGLLGLPDPVHPSAINAMKDLIGNPKFPVSGWFIQALAVLELKPATPEQQLAELTRLSNLLWGDVMAVLPTKQGAAQAMTAQALLAAHPNTLTQEGKTELSKVLESTLLQLSPESQINVLENDWTQVDSSKLVPALRQLAQKPLENPGSNESTSYTTRSLKSLALKRWYQLDAEGAKSEALSQIGSAHPSLTAESLSFLGPLRLPQFEATWADAFRIATDYTREQVLASLLAHYGTGAALRIVRDKVAQNVGEWACAPQSAALAYLVRFDPAGAKPLLERAVKERGANKSACNHSMFQDLERFSHHPLLRQVALESLDDPDPEVVLDAVNYLRKHAEAADEEPIAKRYAQWTRHWQGRARDLEAREAGSLVGNWQEMGLGQSLATALIANQGWLASETLVANTLAQCVGEQMCQTINQLAIKAQKVPRPISILWNGDGEDYEIAQYSPQSLESLKEKIAQYPKGTRFTISADDGGNGRQTKETLEDFLAQQGMKVDKGQAKEASPPIAEESPRRASTQSLLATCSINAPKGEIVARLSNISVNDVFLQKNGPLYDYRVTALAKGKRVTLSDQGRQFQRRFLPKSERNVGMFVVTKSTQILEVPSRQSVQETIRLKDLFDVPASISLTVDVARSIEDANGNENFVPCATQRITLSAPSQTNKSSRPR